VRVPGGREVVMRWLRVLVKGFHGHPVHAPLTDVTVGALTVGALAAVGGWVGLATDLLVPTAFVAVVIGLLAAVPTAVTGLADLLDIPAATPARTTALIHLGLVSVAVATFLLAALLLHPGLEAHEVPTAAAVTAVVGLVLLTAAAWVGGALSFAHGVRVAGDLETPTAEALRPRTPPTAGDGPGSASA
jgi:uncharacterized membrane protein